MSGGGTTQTSQVQSNNPPSFLQQPLNYAAQQAQGLYRSSAPNYYPGTTVANPSPTTQAGIQAATGLGLNGTAGLNAGQRYLTNTLNPSFLNVQNANQAALNKSISDAVIPNVDAQFSLGGRYGSGAHQYALTSGLANAIAPQMYGQYQQNQQIQQNAAGMAPAYNAAVQSNVQGLQQAGSLQDQIAQNQINGNIDRWNYNQNLPAAKLQQLIQNLQGVAGNYGTSSSTGTQPTGTPGIGQDILGLAGGFLGGLI